MPTVASELLAPGLLDGVSILVAPATGARTTLPRKVRAASASSATAASSSLGEAVGEGCAELGADVHMCACDLADEQALDQAIAEIGGLSMLALDGAELLGQGSLSTCLESAWNVTRAVVNRAFLPAARGGRIVYLAPPSDAGEHAEAARAGLENLARTLSVEWARHGTTVVTIALGDSATAGEAAALTAYLASPAGAYFSGCLLDLRGPR